MQKQPTVNFSEKELSELTKLFQENLKPIVEAMVEKTMIKLLTEHRVVFTKNGKKMDTYDLIRNFALEAIGISENGKINPELLKVVREEVANIIAKEGLKNVNKPVIDNTEDDEEDENCCTAYHDGYEDGYNTAIDDANELISAIGLDIFLDIDKDGNLTLSDESNVELCDEDSEDDEECEETAEESDDVNLETFNKDIHALVTFLIKSFR